MLKDVGMVIHKALQCGSYLVCLLFGIPSLHILSIYKNQKKKVNEMVDMTQQQLVLLLLKDVVIIARVSNF